MNQIYQKLLKNFNVNVNADADWDSVADASGSATALPEIRPGKLKIMYLLYKSGV